jgi:ubiquinone/menaquinone biosynthesis C-methylase UbiE
MRWIALFASLAAMSSCAKRTEAQIQQRHGFDDVSHWAATFEDPSRDAWQQPEEVIAALGLPLDAVLADVGAATGYFSVRFARVLSQGTVYGVDVESSMVDYLRQRAEAEKLKNLKVVMADFDDAKLPEPVDCVLIVNTVHHIDSRTAYFRKLAQSLKPGGRIAIIDFKKGSKRGPPDAEKLTPQSVIEELKAAGLRPLASWSFLPEQYFLTFGRAG